MPAPGRQSVRASRVSNGSLSERWVDTMRAVRKPCLLVFALVATALGQSRFAAGPPTAATGPGFAVSAGYTYLA